MNNVSANKGRQQISGVHNLIEEEIAQGDLDELEVLCNENDSVETRTDYPTPGADELAGFVLKLPKTFRIGDTVDCSMNPTWKQLSSVTWVNEKTLMIDSVSRTILGHDDTGKFQTFRCEEFDDDDEQFGQAEGCIFQGQDGIGGPFNREELLVKLRAKIVDG